MNMMYATTKSPGKLSQDDAARVAIAFRNRTWDLRSIYSDVADNFNAEVGFVPRPGVKSFYNSVSLKVRPRALSGWIREIAPTVERQVYWTQANQMETRYFDIRLPIAFQDGAALEAGRNSSFERLFKPFRIQNEIRIPIGHHWFDDYFIQYETSRARRVGITARAQNGQFYSGNKLTYTGGAVLRLNHHFNAALNYSRNNIDLPFAKFKTDLVTTRLNYSFSTQTFLNALIQYNTDAKQWSSNIRFNIIHRPLSDFFVVYNERRNTLSGVLLDRAVIVKFTYMVGH